MGGNQRAEGGGPGSCGLPRDPEEPSSEPAPALPAAPGGGGGAAAGGGDRSHAAAEPGRAGDAAERGVPPVPGPLGRVSHPRGAAELAGGDGREGAVLGGAEGGQDVRVVLLRAQQAPAFLRRRPQDGGAGAVPAALHGGGGRAGLALRLQTHPDPPVLRRQPQRGGGARGPAAPPALTPCTAPGSGPPGCSVWINGKRC